MSTPKVADLTPSQFQRIASTVKEASGINLTTEKLPLVNSRLAKRLRKLQLPDFESYCNLIGSAAGKAEREEMLSAMTTNVTSFFRENHHFEELKKDYLPELLERAAKGGSVRIWSAGCSSGEEPYSIAMTIADVCGLSKIGKLDIRILATDIDPYVLDRARTGVYPRSSLPPTHNNALSYLENLPGSSQNDMQIKPEIRNIIKFNYLNLMGDWPMRRSFDMIFCRNVLIYFDAPTQESLLSRFAKNLSPDGGLFIGHSERVPPTLMSSFHRGALTSYRRRNSTS